MSLPTTPPGALLKKTMRAVSLFGNGINKYILWQLPQCNITSNPYSGGGRTGNTGTFGLLHCIAIQYGAISAVDWFYLPPGGYGYLLSIETNQYPNVSAGFSPTFYINENSILNAGDCCPDAVVSTPISPGWHMAVFEEWAASTSGPFYITLYLDGQYIGSTSTTEAQMFGFGIYPYDYIGSGYSCGWEAAPCGWFFFNGAIAYIALYNRVLNPGEVMAIYQGCEISNGLVAKYTGDSYDPSTEVWNDTINGYNAVLVSTGYKPDVINLLSLRDCPTCPQLAVPLQAFPPIVNPTQPFVPPPRPP
jgi:hypothetical protein